MNRFELRPWDPHWPPPPLGRRRARRGRHESVLGKILEADTNLVIWRREGGPAALPPAALDYTARLADRGDAFEVGLDEGGRPRDLRRMPRWPGRDALIEDWAKAQAMFRELVNDHAVEAKVEMVTHDKCRLFHGDFNRLRWLCTYAGPGTQWVADGDVDRVALARDDIRRDQRNQHVVPDARRIQQVDAGDVILLKGYDFPGNAGGAAVHRSPPLAERGLTRLLLTLTSR